MSDYLARRRARHEAATAAPWKCTKLYGTTQPGSFVWHVANMWNREADHEFAAHARNDEAATLDVLDAAAKLREPFDRWFASWPSMPDDVESAIADLLDKLDALEGEREPADG